MKILDFQKAKQKRPVVKIATKFMFIYRKLEQGIIDHDKVIGRLNTPQDIQARILSALDSKISSIQDIDKMYYMALGVARRCK